MSTKASAAKTSANDVQLGELHRQSLTPTDEASRQSDEDRSLSLAFGAAEAMVEKKAENVKVLDVAKSSGFTDYFVICSAMNERQVGAIAESISDHLRVSLKAKPRSIEGESEARWVLMDYGDIVVHIFLDALRDFYDLEGKWQSAKKVALPSHLFEPAAAPDSGSDSKPE
jgi:ribosome-associated protein